MIDVRLLELADRQHGCFSLAQASALGVSEDAVRHRLAQGRLVVMHRAVFAFAPLSVDDAWPHRMAATLTEPGTVLSHSSAAAAFGFRPWRGRYETVTRPGDGGPVRCGDVLVMRSRTLEGQTTVLRGVPATTAERTLVDLAAVVDARELARAVREAIRLGCTTPDALLAATLHHRGRRGVARLRAAVARYVGLPFRRARSDAESVALLVLHEAGRPAPLLNRRVAGAETDLSWPDRRLIIEIDGPQFHLDAAEDARKQRLWEAAGWTVRRLPSQAVYDHPERLLALAPQANVDEGGS